MASIKSITLIAFLSLGLISNNPVLGQTRSTLDFWLTFGELLTTDVINALTSGPPPTITIPDFQWPSLPSLPNYQLPKIDVPDISISVPSMPSMPSMPPAPAQSLPATIASDFEAYKKYISQLLQLYHMQNSSPAWQMPPSTAPATPAPVQQAPWPVSAPVPPTQPCTDGCNPEKVRIVVVEDCDEKHSKSSESCEDSDEVGIVVPYTNRGRYQHMKK